MTGGIASGKSTVAGRLVERGAELVDADDVARDVVLPATPAWHEIVEAFGEGVLDEDGFVDRPALGNLVFRDPSKRATLNRITHPRIAKEIADRLEVLAPLDGVVVVDVPLLVELGVDRDDGDPAHAPRYDAVLVVAARRETQLQRLTELRQMSPEDARARVDAQAPLDEKLSVADHVIWNEGTLEELLSETDRVADELIEASEQKAARERQGLPND